MSEHRSEDLSEKAELDSTQPVDSAATPRSRPTPTGRARRAAAAGVNSGTEVRRPSPRPAPTESAGTATPDLSKRTPAKPAPAAEATATEPDDTPKLSRRERRAQAAQVAPTEAWPAQQQQQPGRSPLWLALAFGVLVLVGVAALVVALRLSVSSGSTGERDQALAAAKSEVPVILSYNYKTFDAGLAKSKASLTGRAVTDYTKAMTTSIKPNAVKVKAVVQASTDGAGIESVSPDGKQVTVVVFGEQKVTNSTLSAPRTDIFRVRATLDLVGSKWLVSKFDQI